jgi:hypothetical protein
MLWYDGVDLPRWRMPTPRQTVFTREGDIVAVYRWTHTRVCRLCWRAGILRVLVLSMLFALCYAQVPTVITSDGTMSTVITQQDAVFNSSGGNSTKNAA